MSAKVVEPCSARLKKALAIRNMRQADLCEKTKIPKSAISHYLKGSFVPKQDRAFIIAQTLDVSPAWLMGYDVPMEKTAQPEQNIISPDKVELTERDKSMLEIFRLIPEEQQRAFLEMGRAYANSLKKD